MKICLLTLSFFLMDKYAFFDGGYLKVKYFVYKRVNDLFGWTEKEKEKDEKKNHQIAIMFIELKK